MFGHVFLERGSRRNTPGKQQSCKVLKLDPQHIRTTPVLPEPLRRLLGGEESFRLCEMPSWTTEGTSEHRINLGLLGIPVLARPGVSDFVWGYLLP